MKIRFKKKDILITIGAVTSSVLAFVIGYKLSESNFEQNLIDICESDSGDMVIEDNKTGLLYEVHTECIGD